MPGFNSIAELVAADLEGRRTYATFRKIPNLTTAGGAWFDFATLPGLPAPINYGSTPLTAKALRYSTHGGIYHGGPVSPATKVVRETTILAGVSNPTVLLLCDYLLYYPFVDEAVLTEQLMTNNVSLPRSTDGASVQMFAVSFGARVGAQSFQVRYTNSAGVAGRVTPPCLMATPSVTTSPIGQLVTSATSGAGSAPFLPLQYGDTGVRSIEGVTMLGADSGIFTLVLAKALGQILIRGLDAPVENDFLLSKATAPRIEDDACLQLLVNQSSSLSNVTYIGSLTTAWN